MTMFQMIDQLEPLIPQEEMNALHNSTHYLWTKNNPEAHMEIIKRNNAKQYAKRKEREGKQ